jgi:glycosyltransferase involved in cell wall biosynthesis
VKPRDVLNSRSFWLYQLYSRLTWPDGILSPYRLLRDQLEKSKVKPCLIGALEHFLIDAERFAPVSKQNLVVWAGRLDNQKRPLMFVEAIDALGRANPSLLNSWRFAMHGRGSLQGAIQAKIAQLGLDPWLTLTSMPDMKTVFGVSSVYVSTQDFENFSSMSMLEAMASGNAIVARPVGETARWVRDGVNGRLPAVDGVEGLCKVLGELLTSPESVERMGRASRRIALLEHRPAQAYQELEDFFDRVLRQVG